MSFRKFSSDYLVTAWPIIREKIPKRSRAAAQAKIARVIQAGWEVGDITTSSSDGALKIFLIGLLQEAQEEVLEKMREQA